MKTFILSLTILLLSSVPSTVYAQSTAQWGQGNVASQAQAQGFIYKAYVTPAGSSVSNAPVTLAGVVCTGAPLAACTAPIATPSLVTGTKVELTATDPTTGLESAKGTPFISPVAVPTGLRIIP